MNPSTVDNSMSKIATLTEMFEFNRVRTLGLLDTVADCGDPAAALAWRPGAERAHIAWQFMHIGITEEIFATERLGDPERPRAFEELWPRFRGGSVPDDNVPSIDEIRSVLQASRTHWLETLSTYRDEQLDEIPARWTERGLSLLQILHIVSWHEGHHQGQAHITFNMYQASR